MKRLKKKADDRFPKRDKTQTLYHFTSARHLIDAMDEGYITSGGYNGKESGGGKVTYYRLNNGGEGQSVTLRLKSIETYQKDSSRNKFDQAVLDKVEEIKKNNENWEDQTLELKYEKPSGNEIGVYLKNEPYDDLAYGSKAVEKYEDKTLPNTSVMLQLKVYEDALGPDTDDVPNVSPNSDTPLWKQTLDESSQCLHNGPIDVEYIEGVTFYNTNFRFFDDKFENAKSFNKWAARYMEFQKKYESQEAYEAYSVLLEAYENYEPEENALEQIVAKLDNEGIAYNIESDNSISISDQQSFLTLTNVDDFLPIGGVIKINGGVEASIASSGEVKYPEFQGFKFVMYPQIIMFADNASTEFLNSPILSTRFIDYFEYSLDKRIAFSDTTFNNFDELLNQSIEFDFEDEEFDNLFKNSSNSRLRKITERGVK